MKIGEPFNPRYEACRFFPAELVDKRRDLTDGQKLLYHRLVGWARLEDGERDNERAGEVWRSHDTIGQELGKCERQIRRDFEALESVGLLGHRTRDGRKSNTYFFLFHASFDRTSESAQTPSPARECPVATGHPRPLRSDLSGLPRPANHKAFNHKTESSLSEDSGRRREQQPAPAKTETTTTAPPEFAELFPDWLDADAQRRIWNGCRQFAADCTPAEVGEAVRVKIRVLGKKTNPGLLISSVPKMFEGPRGFHHGFRQRAAEQERQRQELERIEQLAVPTVVSNTGANGLERSQEPPSDMTPKVSAPTSPAAEVCLRCGSDGVVNGTVSWCDCERGREQRRARPGYVDYLIRKGWNPGAIAAAVQPRPPQSEPGPLRDVATAAGGVR